MKALWIICLILSAGCIGLTVKSLLNTKEKSLLRIVKMVLYLAEASFLLYIPIFFLQNSFLTALLADMINVMRVVSMDAGYLDNKDFMIQNIGDGFFFRLYMAAMGLIHFLMPLLSIMAIYSIFFMFFAQIRLFMINLHTRRPVFIFNTANRIAVLLATDIQKNEEKGDFIFAGISDNSSDADAELLGSTIIHPDNIENIKIKHTDKRDVFYFLLSEDEDANIKDALDRIEKLSDASKDIQKHTHIYVSAKSGEVESLLDSSLKGEIDIHILRAEEVAVYKLLDEHPLYENAPDKVISVLVVGFDAMGETFVRAASWCGQILGYRLKINVMGIDIADKISNFKFCYPGYENCSCLDLNFYDCKGNSDLFETMMRNCKDTTYAVITQGTDMEITETAIRVRREYLKQDYEYSRAPEIYAFIRDTEQAAVVNNLKTSYGEAKNRLSYKLVSFGCDEEIYTYENIIDSDRDCLGINVFMVMESLYSPEALDVSEEIESYNMLEVNKRANVAMAMHIRYKLAQLGLDYTRDVSAREVDFDSYLTDDMLDKLTRSEHDRWRMFMISEGWTGADMDDINECRDCDLSTEQYFSPIFKIHPFICDFDELETRSENLKIPNVAVNERKLMRNIPEILNDRWGITGVSYKIIKKK